MIAETAEFVIQLPNLNVCSFCRIEIECRHVIILAREFSTLPQFSKYMCLWFNCELHILLVDAQVKFCVSCPIVIIAMIQGKWREFQLNLAQFQDVFLKFANTGLRYHKWFSSKFFLWLCFDGRTENTTTHWCLHLIDKQDYFFVIWYAHIQH